MHTIATLTLSLCLAGIVQAADSGLTQPQAEAKGQVVLAQQALTKALGGTDAARIEAMRIQYHNAAFAAAQLGVPGVSITPDMTPPAPASTGTKGKPQPWSVVVTAESVEARTAIANRIAARLPTLNAP
jgi:hypothetical protein